MYLIDPLASDRQRALRSFTLATPNPNLLTLGWRFDTLFETWINPMVRNPASWNALHDGIGRGFGQGSVLDCAKLTLWHAK
jgi:hypothetical protein